MKEPGRPYRKEGREMIVRKAQKTQTVLDLTERSVFRVASENVKWKKRTVKTHPLTHKTRHVTPAVRRSSG